MRMPKLGTCVVVAVLGLAAGSAAAVPASGPGALFRLLDIRPAARRDPHGGRPGLRYVVRAVPA